MDGSHLVYQPDGLSADELEVALFGMMKVAYSPRPRPAHGSPDGSTSD